jgi:apolipoprotein N-acyltransferase
MNQTVKNIQTRFLPLVVGIVISGICWYLSFDLSGNFGLLLWIAPMPIIYISLSVSFAKAFWAAFTAYLLGWLGWTFYLIAVVPIVLVMIFSISIPLIFALTILAAREIGLKYNGWWTIFTFPVLWTTFEFLLIRFSSDGTFGSIAYTQSDFLPVVQVASLTGILGITFVVTLIPSAIAFCLHYRKLRRRMFTILGVALVFLAFVLVFGLIRLNSDSSSGEIRIGMTVASEKIHNETRKPDPGKEIDIAELYAHQIEKLVSNGAKVILLPEKIIAATPAIDTDISHIFADCAKRLNCTIIVGYTRISDHSKMNSAVVFSPEGTKLADYNKVNLFEGERYNGFIPGKGPAIYNYNGVQSGVVVCKDMDFHNFLRRYVSEGNVSVIYAPAWDFVKDDWLHSRMAIMRGVENGFAVVRNARLGRLTISDNRGRVLNEASSIKGEPVSLVGNVEIIRSKTLFSRLGDWFGWLNVLGTLVFLALLFKSKKTQEN